MYQNFFRHILTMSPVANDGDNNDQCNRPEEGEQAMKWRTDKTSTRVEDRRGTSSRIPGGAAGGIGGIGLIIILVAAIFLGVDPGQFIQGTEVSPESYGQQPDYTQADQEVFNSSARVFTDTEQTWSIIFEDQLGRTYSPPNLVVFEDYVSTGNTSMVLLSRSKSCS